MGYDEIDAMNKAIASAVRREISHDNIPIVLGGDCIVSPGIVAGSDAKRYWLDGDRDFNPWAPERQNTVGHVLIYPGTRDHRDLLINKAPVRGWIIFLLEPGL